MFGKINTKAGVSAYDVFRKAIDAALDDAEKAHVGTKAIVSYMRSQAQVLENRAYRGEYVPPKVYGQDGKLIDTAAQVAAARAARQKRLDDASVIPPHLRQRAASGYKVP